MTVPLANQPTNEEHGNKKHQNSPSNKGHCGKCGLLLDALARTFCLPLLGWSLMVDRWEEDQLCRQCQWFLQFMPILSRHQNVFRKSSFRFHDLEFLTFFFLMDIGRPLFQDQALITLKAILYKAFATNNSSSLSSSTRKHIDEKFTCWLIVQVWSGKAKNRSKRTKKQNCLQK